MKASRKSFKHLISSALVVVALFLAVGASAPSASAAEPEAGPAAEEQAEHPETRWDLAAAIAAAIIFPCLAAGYAVAKVGAAALGAASENPELLGRSLILVGLGEGIAIYGLVLAILLYTKI